MTEYHVATAPDAVEPSQGLPPSRANTATSRLRPGSSGFALALTVLSLLAWWTWALQQTCHPFHDLSCGIYTDHFSHMNTGRLFTEVGIDIWRKPLRENGRPLTDAERAALPADVQKVNPIDIGGTFPGWPADKPFVSSWNFNPRFHPPGDMLLTAPVALLYSFTHLSFSGANLLLILLFLLYVHIPIYLVFRHWGTTRARAPAGLLVGSFVYLVLIHWALEGFYEGLLVAPLLLCARALWRKRGATALLWFSGASVLHFRALFLAPWAAYAVYLVVTQREWRTWGPSGWVGFGLTCLCAAAAIIPFILVWPYLQTIPVSVAVNPTVPNFHVVNLIPFLVVLALGAAAFITARAWLDLAVVSWLGLMCVLLHEAYYWDILTLLAWLLAPIAAGMERLTRVRDGRILVVLSLSALVFHTTLTPEWLSSLGGTLAA